MSQAAVKGMCCRTASGWLKDSFQLPAFAGRRRSGARWSLGSNEIGIIRTPGEPFFFGVG